MSRGLSGGGARLFAVLLVPAAIAAGGVSALSPQTAPLPIGRAPVAVQLLALNDFHGHLDPPTGSDGGIGSIPAGGAEYLATHLAELKATNPNTIIVSAGDNIGASPLQSGLFHDEPAIEALSTAGLAVSSVGNHEFDKGWRELWRMQTGGCHPVDGCQDRTPFAGDASLQVSTGFTYTYNSGRPVGERVDRASIKVDGQTIQPGAEYPVVMNEFLASGGSGFTTFAEGKNPVNVGIDLDAFTAYFGRHSPVVPGSRNRIIRTGAIRPPLLR